MENRAVYEIMSKNMVELDRPQMTMYYYYYYYYYLLQLGFHPVAIVPH